MCSCLLSCFFRLLSNVAITFVAIITAVTTFVAKTFGSCGLTDNFAMLVYVQLGWLIFSNCINSCLPVAPLFTILVAVILSVWIFVLIVSDYSNQSCYIEGEDGTYVLSAIWFSQGTLLALESIVFLRYSIPQLPKQPYEPLD